VPTTKIELKELGPKLPLGIPGPDGQLQRDIVCKPWRGLEERAVGQLRGEAREDGNFTTRLLAYMYDRMGHHDFTQMSMPEKEVVISQMFFGDALYAYFWLRTQCVGYDLNMDVTCPHCSFEYKYKADLETLEVRSAEDLEAVVWQYDLKHPFEIRGKTAESFEISPSRWSTIHRATKQAIDTGIVNPNATKMDVMRSCVTGVVGVGPLVLTEMELDYMTKIDIETLSSRIDELEIGPNMLVHQKCTRCRRGFKVSLDWDYSSFFEVSSR